MLELLENHVKPLPRKVFFFQIFNLSNIFENFDQNSIFAILKTWNCFQIKYEKYVNL